MAARNLTVNFAGVVSLATHLTSAVEKKESFRTICVGQPGHDEHAPAPVTMPKMCAQCGTITDVSVLMKGRKDGEGYALVTQDQVADAKAYVNEYKGSINLVPHPASEFFTRTTQGGKVNYLTPASEAVAGQYATLAKFIEAHPELAFAGLHTPLSSTALWVVTAQDGVLVMSERTRSQQLRPVPSTEGEPIPMLATFLETTLAPENEIVMPYSPDAYEDGYEEAIKKLIATADRVTFDQESAKPIAAISDADLIAKLELLGKAS